jgi:hypothetical protein
LDVTYADIAPLPVPPVDHRKRDRVAEGGQMSEFAAGDAVTIDCTHGAAVAGTMTTWPSHGAAVQ